MSTTLIKTKDIKRKRYLIDAKDFTLGRLATRVATVLIGKNQVNYTPHIDSGNFVVVVNGSQIKFSGRKFDQKEYTRFSGYPGGITRTKLKDLIEKRPDFVIEEAVRLMLPKNRLQKHRLRRLTIVKSDKTDLKIDEQIK